MPRWERTIEINAAPEKVWSVLSDIERWPEWTPSMLSVKLVEDGPLAPGTQAIVHPKGTVESTWTVSEVTPNRSFTWDTKVRGARTVGGHEISPTAGGSRVTLSIVVDGFAAKLLKPIIGRTITTNMDQEAEGLKRVSEAAA